MNTQCATLTLAGRRDPRPLALPGAELPGLVLRLQPVVRVAHVLDAAAVRGAAVEQAIVAVVDDGRRAAVHVLALRGLPRPLAAQAAGHNLHRRRDSLSKTRTLLMLPPSAWSTAVSLLRTPVPNKMNPG